MELQTFSCWGSYCRELDGRQEGWSLGSGHGEGAMLEWQGWKAGTAPVREDEEGGGPPNPNPPTYQLSGPCPKEGTSEEDPR